MSNAPAQSAFAHSWKRIAASVGKEWKATDLRRKSWDDLHKLWYVSHGDVGCCCVCGDEPAGLICMEALSQNQDIWGLDDLLPLLVKQFAYADAYMHTLLMTLQ